jgi:hypothetical protein
MESRSESAPDGEAIRQLLSSKADVGRASGRRPVRDFLCWISRGRLGRSSGWPEFLDCPPRGRTRSPFEPAGVSEQSTWWILRTARASSCSLSTIEYADGVALAGSKSPTRSRGTRDRVLLALGCPRCATSIQESRGTRSAGTWEKRARFGPQSETGCRADTVSVNSASTFVPRADSPGPQDSGWRVRRPATRRRSVARLRVGGKLLEQLPLAGDAIDCVIEFDGNIVAAHLDCAELHGDT